MKKLLSLALLLALLVGLAACSNDAPVEEEENPGITTDADAQDPTLENPDTEDPDTQSSAVQAEDYTVIIDVQDYGTITVALDGTAAPITVNNFISLVNEGFYDGLTFHRIMDGFMIQGGDPLGTGGGGSDQTITGEFTSNGFQNNLTHTRGTISMARSQNMDSASSQFFIVQADSLFLDGEYAAFGHVTSGMDVVDTICQNVENIGSNGEVADEDKPIISSIRVVTEE